MPIVPLTTLLGAADYLAYVILAWTIAITIGLPIAEGIIRSREVMDD